MAAEISRKQRHMYAADGTTFVRTAQHYTKRHFNSLFLLINNRRVQAAIGPLLGMIFFFLIFDAKLLDPTYVEWLLANEDSRMGFIGWHFFRLEPWRFPPGAATQYGMEIGSSIVFTDAVPLFAIVFKMFDSLLPEKFQYMGLWILTCYIAQGAVGWFLSGLLTHRTSQRCVMVIFFVASPIMLSRAIGHHSKMGHWLLLAALYVYLRPFAKYWNRWWYVLLSVVALVNAYLLYMTMAIWSADLIRRTWLERVLSYQQAARSIVTTMLAVLCTMWLAGYFTLPIRDFSNAAVEYGKFAANLNSFWNPLWLPTLFLSPRPLVPGSEIEGSNYLGMGVMAMLPIAAFALLRRPVNAQTIKPHIPLIVVALTLWVMALSHQVAWGDRIVMTVPLPPGALDALASVRGSARLLWVAYYGVILAALAVIATRFRPRVATAILVAGLAVQMTDAFPWYVGLSRAMHEYFTADTNRMKSLRASFWPIAAKHYRSIVFVPVAHKPPDYDALALFAAEHGMAINVGYFARVSDARIEAANATLQRDLMANTFRPESVYVFWSGDSPAHGLRPQDGVGVVDGYTIVAPGWFEFKDCCTNSDQPLRRGGRLSAVTLPLHLTFGQASAHQWMRSGWQADEVFAGRTYVWSDGPKSVLEIPLGGAHDVVMTFECRPFLFPGNPQQRVAITLNGALIKDLSLHSQESRYSVVLPKQQLRDSLNTIELRYAYARRPQEVLSASRDTRQLGVAWFSMDFETR